MTSGKRAKQQRRRDPLSAVRGAVGKHLLLSQKTRDRNLEDCSGHYLEVVTAFNQSSAWFDWIIGLCTKEPLVGLLMRAQTDALRGFEAGLSGDYPRVNDVGRDLMEIEVLLRDFCREPTQVDKWALSINDHATGRGFSFGRTIDRLRSHEGLSQDYVLPDTYEYQAHSEGLHPTPRGHGPGVWGAFDREQQFRHDVSDLLTHLDRVGAATVALAEATTFFDDPTEDPPPLDAVIAVQARFEGEMASILTAWSAAGLQIGHRQPYRRGSRPYRLTKEEGST